MTLCSATAHTVYGWWLSFSAFVSEYLCSDFHPMGKHSSGYRCRPMCGWCTCCYGKRKCLLHMELKNKRQESCSCWTHGTENNTSETSEKKIFSFTDMVGWVCPKVLCEVINAHPSYRCSERRVGMTEALLFLSQSAINMIFNLLF